MSDYDIARLAAILTEMKTLHGQREGAYEKSKELHGRVIDIILVNAPIKMQALYQQCTKEYGRVIHEDIEKMIEASEE